MMMHLAGRCKVKKTGLPETSVWPGRATAAAVKRSRGVMGGEPRMNGGAER